MSTQNPARPRGFASAADRFAGLTDPSMGDEREQTIILRAGTVAMTASIFTIQLLGILLAVLGAGLWSGIVVIAAVVPSLVYTWYCRSSGLDVDASFSRVTPRRKVWTNVAGLALVFAWVGAVMVHMISGAPLIPAGLGSVDGGDTSTAGGLLVGALVGGALGVLALVLRSRRGSRRAAADPEEDDD